MSPESSTESYPAFAHIGLRENPGKNLNQVNCPDRKSNLGHLVSWPDVLTVTLQVWTDEMALGRTCGKNASYQMGTHGDTVGSKNWLEKPWTTVNQMGDEFKLQLGGLWTRIGHQRTRWKDAVNQL
ncbi:hypothetical protein ANN_17220 [Periplaneta americana]|uniref:Uncharacterized protein n=1 Tax=Periplaneta americana TaxID=6978 RepID=A0ABQ8SUF1_PERAM|nr:hypothetical protein ANN_17220 [Periplaneta americana]